MTPAELLKQMVAKEVAEVITKTLEVAMVNGQTILVVEFGMSMDQAKLWCEKTTEMVREDLKRRGLS